MKGGLLLVVSILAAGCSMPPQQPVADAVASDMAGRLAQLELRRTRLEDLNAIKRLQRAYGYYMDEGQWNDMADLFADDATIEIGFDGVYRGKPRIRQYLNAMGDGRNGLAKGQLNEHFQLMPVVTLGDDGVSARGTWRDVMLTGQLGRHAHWGEGPFENQYIKQDGIWKIRSLHWFQTLFVPYDGGWTKHPDSNGGHFVPAGLRPDAPTSIAYKSWPGAFTPPFHFRSQYPGFKPLAPPANVKALTQREMSTRLRSVARDVQRLADHDAVESLQRIYGYYIDKGQWSDAAALFSDDAEFVIQGKSVYRGPAGVLRYLRAVGPEGPQPGRLYEHMQLQPIVNVAEDGRSAKVAGICLRSSRSRAASTSGLPVSTKTSIGTKAASGRSGACTSIRRWSRLTKTVGRRPPCPPHASNRPLPPMPCIGAHPASTTNSSWRLSIFRTLFAAQ